MAQQLEIDKEQKPKMPWAHLRLPPFPQVAVRVMQLAKDENVQLHALSELVSSDPAFASEVLTIANSALYSLRFPATNIVQAIAVLGARNLQGLCMTVGVRAYLGRSLNQPSMQGIWHHELACALVAEKLGFACGMDKETAYTCGLIHDIGRLALAVIRPKEYALLLATHTGPSGSMLQCERDLFGGDHCETGRRLVASWNLSPEIAEIVDAHHSSPAVNEPWGMPRLINVSCRMADTAGFPAYPGCIVTPFAELLADIPDLARKQFPADIESLAAEVATKIAVIEAA